MTVTVKFGAYNFKISALPSLNISYYSRECMLCMTLYDGFNRVNIILAYSIWLVVMWLLHG